MTIDIISYSEQQLAALSAEKLLEVRRAQIKKDALSEELAERLKTEKGKLINNGTFPSNLWSMIVSKLTQEYNAQVEQLRDSLLFYLHYVADDAPIVYPDVPYTVDYSLSEDERMFIVKEYYETTYTDKAARYAAFKKDDFVKVYIGELYLPLHDYFYTAE